MSDDLNAPQVEAVTHFAGPLLVFAGAGSGKTRVITYRIANLVLEHNVAPYRILAVTFTNKAAGEMKLRLGKLLGTDIAKDLWVGTFHSICARLLRRHYEAVGLGRDFVIYDDGDQRTVMNRVVKDRKVDDKRYPPRMLLSFVHKKKQEGIGPSDLGQVDPVLADVFAGYETALQAQNACDFDDLLLHVLRLLETTAETPALVPESMEQLGKLRAGASLRLQFSHVLVDEFQDTNAVQYRLVRGFARETQNLAVVGDDDQSIYRWRGADVRNIRGFSSDFPQATVVRLEQNYRSSRRIVASALGVIEPSTERVPKDLWTANAEGGHVIVRTCVDERDEARCVASEIESLTNRGLERREIAILYRTHAQSRVLEEVLRAARIPHRIVGGLRFFDRAEVKDLVSYLRVIANPRSDVDLARILNVPARGIGATTLERLLTIGTLEGTSLWQTLQAVADGAFASELGTAPRKKIVAFVKLLDELFVDAAGGKLPSELAEAVLSRTGYRKILEQEQTEEAEARLQNLGELIGSIRDDEAEVQAEGRSATLTDFLERAALTASTDNLSREEDSVVLMTVHAAKGLEYEAVFITGLEEGLFPFQSQERLVDDTHDIEEERRLAYVAITRARTHLYLHYASSRTLYGQARYGVPSRFLRDLPRDAVKQVGPTRTDTRETVRRSSASWGPLHNDYSSGRTEQEPTIRKPFQHPMTSHTSAEKSPGYQGSPRRDVSPIPERQAGERFVELDDENVFRRGMAVRHRTFGDGRVMELLEGADPKVLVYFPGVGEKTVLIRFLQSTT